MTQKNKSLPKETPSEHDTDEEGIRKKKPSKRKPLIPDPYSGTVSVDSEDEVP